MGQFGVYARNDKRWSIKRVPEDLSRDAVVMQFDSIILNYV